MGPRAAFRLYLRARNVRSLYQHAASFLGHSCLATSHMGLVSSWQPLMAPLVPRSNRDFRPPGSVSKQFAQQLRRHPGLHQRLPQQRQDIYAIGYGGCPGILAYSKNAGILSLPVVSFSWASALQANAVGAHCEAHVKMYSTTWLQVGISGFVQGKFSSSLVVRDLLVRAMAATRATAATAATATMRTALRTAFGLVSTFVWDGQVGT